MRFGWLSFHMEGVPALQAVLQQDVAVQAIITLNEEQRSKRSAAADYGAIAHRFGLPLYAIANINHDTSIQLLKELDLDVAFVLGWSQIIRPPALSCCRVGMVGAHASFLPHNRGSAPINWALINGETESGNTLMWLSSGVDEGSIIDQTRFTISPYDTCASLYDKVAESNRQLVLRLIPRLLRGERPGRPQPSGEGDLLERRRPEQGRIDWSNDSLSVYNFIRALTRPYPGAFSHLEHERWLIWKAALLPVQLTTQAPPGEVLGPVISPVAGACGQAVATGRGVAVLLEVEDARGRILGGQELSDQVWRGKVWAND